MSCLVRTTTPFINEEILLEALKNCGYQYELKADKIYIPSLHRYRNTYFKLVNGKYVLSYDSYNSNISSELYKVVRVVDGDTLIIDYNGTEERVRLIGVDTPESVHPDKEKNTEFGTTASNFSKDLLTDKYVKIELDVQERDQYGRLLAYIYLDDVMVNKLLLQEGYAKVATYPPNVKYVDDFTAIQEEARNNKKGLWGLE